ncbi:hypothetical protein [Actinomadura sp. SCN-SB]|uniref:hypothetical protein n=1 Tax=Actinomadura sp. SCN-SB TaxID=3373092 RepID=UPI00375049CC
MQDLHTQLDQGFRDLHASREQLTPVAPVFALEHDLCDTDLELLKETVRLAVRQGFWASAQRWWLPFVVYAAESGHNYAGGEYWKTFEDSTPGWRENGDRDRIREWFQRFADDYGGARPQGAFAGHFRIIAWPITHAVLPVYLQRHLAHLLYDFRTGLTAQLLRDPGILGERLAARTGSYPEQFRYFCQNTALLGQVSVALLSGEEDESPYLLGSTLHRLVDGLSRERQSQQWLSTARRTAGKVRAKARGLVPVPRKLTRPSWPERLPRPTDPRLLLRRVQGEWRAYAELPDLSSLITRLPQLSDELRSRRPSVAGAERRYLARGQLLYPGHEVQLARWPRPHEPFIRLERAPDPANHLIADHCAISPGRTWLFRLRAPNLAVEVKGKIMHPGSSYILVVDEDTSIPALPTAVEIPLQATGVRAYTITVPDAASESYAAAFAPVGLSLATKVVIRPVGIVASSWDGEGTVEWLAGEPGMIGIYSEQVPESCIVTLDGHSQTLKWPGGQRDLLLHLEDLSAGTFEVAVALLAESGKTIADGYIAVTVRDPKVRPDSATAGEGIRLLSDPAQPTLSDLWDGRADISIDGPSDSPAQLTVTLLSDTGEKLSELEQGIRLPMTPEAWSQTVRGVRANQRFKGHYDDAQSSRITISRSGIGFATLTCDRGFQPLQWRFALCRNGSYVARLIDRTDGVRTVAEMFTVQEPLVSIRCPASGEIPVPAQGGLVRATAREASATALLPPQPNAIMGRGNRTPTVRTSGRTPGEVLRLAEAHLLWATAHQPADPFANHQCDMVLEAITREIASLIGKGYWTKVERKMQRASEPTECIDVMRAGVGEIRRHRELADQVARNLWHWSTPETLLAGFSEALAGTVQTGDAADNEAIARFVLTLADQPGQILAGWNQADCRDLLAKVLATPVLLRAARFAVLGSRAFNGAVTPGGPW